MKRQVILDLEANGLNPDTIWCVCTEDLETGEEKDFLVTEPGYLESLATYLAGFDEYIGHNLLGYDLPVLRQLAGICVPVSKTTDTLVLSRLFEAKREGGHSLEEWGIRVGLEKVGHDDWERFSPEMLKRCRGDVSLTRKVYNYLLREGREFSDFSIRLEHNATAIFEECRRYGFSFNTEQAHRLYQEVSARASGLRVKIQGAFPLLPKPIREVKYSVNKDGSIPQRLLPWGSVGGDFTAIEWVEFDLDSPKQIVERMNRLGWDPVERTPPSKTYLKGQPKASEVNLLTIPDDAPVEARLLREYIICTNRQRMVTTWLEAVGPDDRIHGSIISTGAHTHRAAHRSPNQANIPGVKDKKGRVNLYGAECRSLWRASEGRKLVGVDAASIQLRILAHLMDDPKFTELVTTGKPHQYNADKIGITYEQAKTFIYAMILGGGDEKIGSIVGGKEKEGKELKRAFKETWPKYQEVLDYLKACASRGYMLMPDGRHIPVPNAHLGMGVALQGIEAILMKLAIIYWYKEKNRRKLISDLVAFVHDETQLDTEPEHCEESGVIMSTNITRAGEVLSLRCPMAGEIKIADNWAGAH